MNYEKLSLANGRGFTLVDADVAPAMRMHQWRLHTCGYAFISHPTRYLHRVITAAPHGMDVDHINGDKLDNRRENLRVVNRSANEANKPSAPNVCGYRGVMRSRGRYRARIHFDGTCLHLGGFDTAEQAAMAYDREARLLRGRFARLNFPDNDGPSLKGAP